MGRDVGGPLQDVLAISRICCDVEDRRRDSPHGVQRCAINEQGIRGKQVGVHGWIGRELRKGGPDRLVQTENVNHFARTSLVELRTYRGGTVEIAACLCSHYRSPVNHNMNCAVGSRSEEHTSELQSLMRISYAVFCLNKKNK